MPAIALADDHLLFREGIVSFIKKKFKDFTVCIEAENGFELLRQLNRARQLPDIAMIDVQMPVIDGTAVTNIICNLYPQMKKMAISGHSHPPAVLSMLKAGTNAYLLKENLNEETLTKAFDSMQQQNIFVDESIENIHSLLPGVMVNSGLATNSIINQFTIKEKLFLQLAATGISYQKISELMNIGIETVYDYQKRLNKKIGCNNRHELTVFAIQHGIAKIARLND